MRKIFSSLLSILAVLAFVKLAIASAIDTESTDSVVKKRSHLITLTDDDWSRSLEGEWMIKFYAPWCYACRSVKADFLQFSEWSEDLHINVAEVDITQYPGLSGRFIVTALPTFYHSINGEFRRYLGERSADAFRDYIINKQWTTVEPINWLRHPNSVIMTLMSWLFKASIILKELHELFTVNYGLAPWISYTIFILATVCSGLAFGMFLVFLIELISPPSKPETNEEDEKAAAGDQEEEEGEEKCKEDEESCGEEIVDENEEAKTCPSKTAATGEEDAAAEKIESSTSVSDEKTNKNVEEDGDNVSQDSNSSQAFKSWERISETEVAESEGDEVRRRNVASRITDITSEECAKDEEAQEVKEVASPSKEPCTETEEKKVEESSAGDTGHSKTE